MKSISIVYEIDFISIITYAVEYSENPEWTPERADTFFKQGLNVTKKHPITMADIARIANVSKPTVSRALSNSPLINPETRRHVLAVASKHGYTVNRNAKNLRQGRVNTIAVSLDYPSHQSNHIADPFVLELLAGVSEALGKRNQDLLLCSPNHNGMNSLVDQLASRSADGLIMIGQGHREATLEKLASAGTPMVVWGAASEESDYCTVGSDNFLGGMLAGRYFLEKGRSRFLFVGDASHAEIGKRREGLARAAEQSPEVVSIQDISLTQFSFESAHDEAVRFLDSARELPDAVFAFSDTAAMAFIRALKSKGLTVPDDVSVVGYNDIPFASYSSPSITTIRQDTGEAGTLLVEKLLQILDGEIPEAGIIETRLIVRET